MALGYQIFRHLYLFSFQKIIRKKDETRLKKTKLPKDIEEYDFREDNVSYLIHRRKDGDSSNGILFDIHGGGWIYGDKKLNRPFTMTMSEKGFTVISLDYRLVDKVHIQDQVKDILDDILSVYRRREELNLDFSKNVFLTGDSAGGMLSGVIIAVSQNQKLQQIFRRSLPIHFDKLVLNHPVSYTSRFEDIYPLLKFRNTRKWFPTLLYGKKYQEDEVYRLISDFSVLCRACTFPETMIITSIGDRDFYKLSLRQKKDLEEQGVRTTLIIGKEKPNFHIYNIAKINEKTAIDTNEKISDFLKGNH